MKIIIIGAGWYGLHSYTVIKQLLNIDIEIIILEKTKTFFENSSNYNQNRLHIGYHYPRSENTRKMCIKGYKMFIQKYREVVDFIDNNYYLISKKSLIDYDTYIKIFSEECYQHTILKNINYENIDGNIINTKEKIINSEKVKQYFLKNINLNDIKFGYEVTNISHKNNKVIINNDMECDLLIDCTYNKLNISKKKYIFELTISLLYNRINFVDAFESLTVMDGEFFSLFPRDISKKTYTLTHVKYTPIIKSSNIEDVNNYKLNDSELNRIKSKMENDTLIVYPLFKEHFEYNSYFLSYKCKLDCSNDSRECIIEEYDNIITVNCGKIIGIFELEEYLKKHFKKYKNI